MLEPTPTAIGMAVAGLLMAVSVLFARASGRIGLPVALLFLGIGILAGSEGIGGIPFEDYGFAFRLGTVALTLILFDGGLNTSIASIRPALKPAAVLATVGVAATAALVALGARLAGLPWREALLLGAIVSSTDAAAVFSVLRGAGLHLRKRVGATLELESGANDPMAVILTLALTSALAADEPIGPALLVQVVVQLVVGAALGIGFGALGRSILVRVNIAVGGLIPVFTVAIALLAFGVPTLLFGSGFLAVYVAGIFLGNGRIPYRTGLMRVHDAIAWFCQVALFLMLGLLAFPSRLWEVAGTGLAIALFLAFVGRPLVVAACVWPFGFAAREVAYMGWVGLRGAVPIVLATFPILSGAPGGERIFDLVFFVVVVSALLQGGTVGWITRLLGMEEKEPPRPPAVLEIASTQSLEGEVLGFFIDPASAVAGHKIADLPFPEGAAVMLVVRGKQLVAAKGGTLLLPGDHAWVFCRPSDKPLVELLFGRAEQS